MALPTADPSRQPSLQAGCQPGSGEHLRIDGSLRIPVVILEKLLRALLVHLRDRSEVGGRLVLRRVWHRAGQSQLLVEEWRGGDEVLSQ